MCLKVIIKKSFIKNFEKLLKQKITIKKKLKKITKKQNYIQKNILSKK